MLRPRWFAAASTAAFALSLAPGARAEPTGFQQFAGTYHATSLDADRAAIARAIEEGTEDMFVIKRAIGRSRLREVNPPIETIRILMLDDTLVTDFDGLRFAAPVDGLPQVGRDHEGDRVQVSFALRGQTLRGHYVGDGGTKDMDFTLSPDGSRLKVAVTVTSDRLPEPIRYQLSFVRD